MGCQTSDRSLPDDDLPHAQSLVSISEGTSPEALPAETGYLALGRFSVVLSDLPRFTAQTAELHIYAAI